MMWESEASEGTGPGELRSYLEQATLSSRSGMLPISAGAIERSRSSDNGIFRQLPSHRSLAGDRSRTMLTDTTDLPLRGCSPSEVIQIDPIKDCAGESHTQPQVDSSFVAATSPREHSGRSCAVRWSMSLQDRL